MAGANIPSNMLRTTSTLSNGSALLNKKDTVTMNLHFRLETNEKNDDEKNNRRRIERFMKLMASGFEPSFALHISFPACWYCRLATWFPRLGAIYGIDSPT